MPKLEIACAVLAVAFLFLWAWFWTGPELRMEQRMYERMAAEGEQP